MSKDVCTWQVLFEIPSEYLRKKMFRMRKLHTFYPPWPGQALAEESRWIFLSNTPVTTHSPALGFAGCSCWILAVKSSQLLTMAGAGHGHPWQNKSGSPRLRKFLFCLLWGATWARLFGGRLCWFLAGVCGLNRRVVASRVPLYFWRATSSSLKRNGPILVLRL